MYPLPLYKKYSYSQYMIEKQKGKNIMYNDYVEIKVVEGGRPVYASILKKLHYMFSHEKYVNKQNTFAISMPRYNKEKMIFGDIIRIFGESAKKLKELNISSALEECGNVIIVSKPKTVPDNKKIVYAKYRKVPANGYRLRIKNYQKKHEADIHEACTTVPFKKYTDPYVVIDSNSNGNPYPLIVGKQFVDEDAILDLNTANTYGFGTCVPEW